MFPILDIGNIIPSLDCDMENLIHLNRGSVAHNVKVKEYPDYYDLTIASRPDYFLPAGYEVAGWRSSEPKARAKGEAGTAESLAKSLQRARRAVRDIAACSDFTHFVTLTLDAEKIERYDYDVIIKRVNAWLSNAVARKELRYVLIPEFHKDGAIHFHGLWSGRLSYVDSGHYTKAGQKIYNLLDWKWGYTGCIELEGEYAKVCNYIMKYITKGSRKVGGRWYLSGGKIRKPTVRYSDAEYREIPASGRYVPAGRVSFKYMRIDKNSKTD